MSLLDIAGIVLFLLFSFLIFKRYWFYSLYSFIRFLFFSVLALSTGLFLASINPYSFFFSKLQIALIIMGILFTLLWKFVQFKKIFFWLDTHLFKVDRFVYFHKLNTFVNIPPSFVASSFFIFFLFSCLLTLSPYSTFIKNQIDRSRLITPLSYKIYFSPIALDSVTPFQGTVFKLPPAISTKGKEILDEIRHPIVIATTDQINEERAKAGLPPLPQVPDAENQNPSSPSQDQSPSGSIPPTSTPPVIKINFPRFNPTSTPYPTASQSFPTNPPSSQNPTSIPTQIPSATPTPIPTRIPKDTRSIEQEIFTLTNQKRSENGVRALSWSEEIAVVARAHSQDMNDRNYFDHNSPEGTTPFQRLSIGGISYTTAGENIASAATATLIVEAWMNSPGHRANILNASFGRIGIGVVENSRYGLLATQDFTN